ncbi:hypothetical protein FQN50_000402 [Emmonsiellopsis sp. PD_5]|nr:hypothetical protein FQN50_000402 [Emmonsiellopsis sp. PD_5]
MQAQRSSYPDPLVVLPLRPPHTHTLILLHGLGSDGSPFGTKLLESTDLPARLPTVKFVFPTASKRRSTMLKKMRIKQWFDVYSLEDPGLRAELQIDGLCETGASLRQLIEKESEILASGGQGQEGYGKIIFGGLSQGCAASIFTLLGGGFGGGADADGTSVKLGGFVGMSGWLPFEQQLRGLARDSDDDDDDDDNPFAQSSELADNAAGSVKQDKDIQVINHVRDIFDLPMLSTSSLSSSPKKGPAMNLNHLQTPCFIGHGSVDEKISPRLGEGMADFLSSVLRMEVMWRAYEGLGHWYSVPDEIEDIVKFLKEKVGVPVVEQ